ncbi:hypothetical protein NX059_008808 [Plenodomus lindquistii]|nr:hypothetical protein NX059_008808 [Plenodomus lindquistii]
MASKLCCTAEEEGRDGSPELPNARVSQVTPANRPLLPKVDGSPASRFTSARSEDLHELREIFDCAQHRSDDRPKPSPIPRSRFGRPSMHSLRSLHKMSSMRSIIRRKFSRDDSGHELVSQNGFPRMDDKTISEEPGTMVRQSRGRPDEQLKITKSNLRKDLLSDKKPDQGGYDPDAEMLDDIANRIGKKTSGKRPSIHSIDWTPSTGRPTPTSSSSKEGSTSEIKRNLHPYTVQKPGPVSFSNRFNQVFSTPNLRAATPGEKDRRLRRSHSATSMGLPKPSPISPLRLPSLSSHDADGVPWSEAMHRSLHLSQFPVPPRHVSSSPRPTETRSENCQVNVAAQSDAAMALTGEAPDSFIDHSAHTVEIHVQQPTSLDSPRPSTSVRSTVRGNSIPSTAKELSLGPGDNDEDNPRSSVHLYSMRISHHLRSGSLLSWDQLADTPELPKFPSLFRERAVSDQSRHSDMQRQALRHDRQTSSSGFTSTKMPSRWGKVVSSDRDVRPDAASSLYSSRPQSPPESFGGSMVSLPQGTDHRAEHCDFSASPSYHTRPQSLDFPPPADDAARTPIPPCGLGEPTSDRTTKAENSRPAPLNLLVRKNSVADTKTSKFREEFSSSPSKRRLTPSSSIAKFLSPKRLSLRSQSEANLQPNSPIMFTDGPADTLLEPVDKERRQSRSLVSLQAEQEAFGKSKGANQVWDRALQAHREEKASMFLHRDKELVVHSSPFRERSGSTAPRRNSAIDDLDPSFSVPSGIEQSSKPLLASSIERRRSPDTHLVSMFRRRAIEGRRDIDSEYDVSAAFEKQGDTAEVVGAWGRYPSHTRHDRTSSAGKLDQVESRDFALEAAIRFASARNDTHDDDLVDPAEHLPSPVLLPGEKKRKKRIGTSRMTKSNSMTFGKALMKNYTKMFRSQSTEFRRHGRGHRSSIVSGGILEFPELELVPNVWTGTESQKDVEDRGGRGNDSMATLRPRRNSSAPNLTELSSRDGANDSEHAQDRARVWSVYYDDCVPSYPRVSTEADRDFRNHALPMRRSIGDGCMPRHSNTFPYQGPKHSRHPSQLSRMSTGSLQSGRPSFRLTGDDGGARDDQSMASVRRSTMDLISKFKEQEASEHERALALTRSGSGRGAHGIRAL